MIKIEKLNKYFNRGKNNENHVLQDVSLELENTGLVCILGESGSGKTTLLNTLGGLDVFQGGSITVDDEVLQKYEADKVEKIRNSKFGYIFQNYYLLQDYTVSYNVKLALNMFEISEEEKEERADYVLDALGMKKYKKKLVSQLSGGQQQRVSIARALVKSPEIILADEPTGNLDEENTLQTMSILKNISKECLVVLVSHERNIARFFADRIVEVQDGKIKKDHKNTPADSYEKMDDSNIYLKDFENNVMENQEMIVNYYSQFGLEEEKNQESKLHLNLAWKNGKLYIQSPDDIPMEFACEETGCEMVNAHRPRLEKQQVENTDYKLPKMVAKKDAHLPAKEIWKMAVENIKLMGKKQAFIIVILLASAVMLTATLADYMTQVCVDKKKVVTEDSHYVTVKLKNASSQGSSDTNAMLDKYFEQYVFAGKYSSAFPDSKATLSLSYNGFSQLSNVTGTLDKYSLVSIDHLERKDLIYGRMPKNRNEIVIDKWLLNNFSDSDNIISSLLQKEESFIGLEVLSPIPDVALTIVGISDNEEPGIYVNDDIALGLDYTGTFYCTQRELDTTYPGAYTGKKLKQGDILIVSSELEDYIKWMDDADQESYRLEFAGNIGLDDVNIVGSVPKKAKVDFVVADADAKSTRAQYMKSMRKFKVYTDDVEGAIAYYKNSVKTGDYGKYFKVDAYSGYERQLANYRRKAKPNVNMKSMLTVIIFLVSLMMIFFTIKSNAMSRSEELTVYRLIGISRSSIRRAYILEMILVTAYTCLPAVLITSGVLKFIGSVPSLELDIIFPWWSVIALIVVMFAANALISILPVEGILRKPPAQLAAKE